MRRSRLRFGGAVAPRGSDLPFNLGRLGQVPSSSEDPCRGIDLRR